MKPFIMSVVAGAVMLAGAITAHAQSVSVEAPSSVEAENLPRLPNVFRDCWEPLPRHCVRPPGLLWFGSAATLQRERRAFRHHRVHTADSE
jgi:hypothetical protein